MFDGTSFPAAWFCSAVTPLTRRLLVYFDSGAYILSALPQNPSQLCTFGYQPNGRPKSGQKTGLVL
jgi:hypothetical protein